MEKRNISYALITSQKNPLKNTSSKSYGHFRIVCKDNLKEIVQHACDFNGEDKETLRFVYENSYKVSPFLDELGVPYEKRSFGVIPSGKKQGGLVLMKALLDSINPVHSGITLEKLRRTKDGFEAVLSEKGAERSVFTKKIILTTGGLGGRFSRSNNITYSKYNIFPLVKELGGEIVNENCLFIHPFGYSKGKDILIGKQSQKGELLDESGDYVFSERVRKMIKDDSYHEHFELVLKEEQKALEKSKIYFHDGHVRLKIEPTVHYTSGGILTDEIGRVQGIKGLYALGECQANGSRNQGRLPGYALTSIVVQGKAIARKISKENENAEGRK